MRENVPLTVCVIGRNEAKNIAALVKSLEPLIAAVPDMETLYVDSASDDASPEIAKNLFDAVFVLKSSPYLSASVGRHVGTLKAKGRWILYLDGDMELASEFVPVISRALELDDQNAGYTGNALYHYDNGRTLLKEKSNKGDGTLAVHFGGAVFLPRDQVLRAGNWSLGIYSNEEIDLYCRLRANDVRIIYRDTLMIHHHTYWESKARKLWRIFAPPVSIFVKPSEAGRDKYYFGFGQCLRRNLLRGSLWNFIRYFPFPFIYIAGLSLSVVLGLVMGGLWGAALFSLVLLYISFKKGPYFSIIYAAFIPQGLLGFFMFPNNYRPEIVEESSPINARQSGAGANMNSGQIIDEVSAGYSSGKRIPWWAKMGLKIILSQIPVKYSTWVKLGVFKHGDILTGFNQLYERFAENVGAYQALCGSEPKTFLELGPGDSIARAMFAASIGAERTWLVDVGDFATHDERYYEECFERLKEKHGGFSRKPDSFSRESVLKFCKAEYKTNGLSSLKQIPDNAVDLSFSDAVMEHIRYAEFQETINELYRVTKPGGVSRHWVDLHDHLGGKLNNLRFSYDFWERDLVQRGGFYTNRLSLSEIAEAAGRTGFNVFVPVVKKWPDVPTSKRKMHKVFQTRSDDDLRVCTFLIEMKKPAWGRKCVTFNTHQEGSIPQTSR